MIFFRGRAKMKKKIGLRGDLARCPSYGPAASRLFQQEPSDLGLSGSACRRAHAACLPAVSRRLQKMRPDTHLSTLLLPPSTPFSPRPIGSHAPCNCCVVHHLSEEASQSTARRFPFPSPSPSLGQVSND